MWLRPNLQWCFDNNRERLIEAALASTSTSGWSYAAVGERTGCSSMTSMFVNGASAHFFRHLVPLQRPAMSLLWPSRTCRIWPLQTPTVSTAEGPSRRHPDGPGLAASASDQQGRANRFYGAFLCSEFLPTEPRWKRGMPASSRVPICSADPGASIVMRDSSPGRRTGVAGERLAPAITQTRTSRLSRRSAPCARSPGQAVQMSATTTT